MCNYTAVFSMNVVSMCQNGKCMCNIVRTIFSHGNNGLLCAIIRYVAGGEHAMCSA